MATAVRQCRRGAPRGHRFHALEGARLKKGRRSKTLHHYATAVACGSRKSPAWKRLCQVRKAATAGAQDVGPQIIDRSWLGAFRWNQNGANTHVWTASGDFCGSQAKNRSATHAREKSRNRALITVITQKRSLNAQGAERVQSSRSGDSYH